MEQIIKILIYTHAFFGGLGLITGTINMMAKKGNKLHKRSGKLFTIGMLVSSAISIPIAWMPNHENLFLFLIGIFTIYLVLSGNRYLTFKTKSKANSTDKLISGIMFLFSVFMILFGTYGVIKGNAIYFLFMFFGGFGLLMTINDFKNFKNISIMKKKWLRNHISRIVGSYIASITAFIVAGLSVESILAWVLPSIIGTIYIVYWQKKLNLR